MLELRQLAAFDAVATDGTFAGAAMRLGYTQSTVSQRIAALERTVGGRLFDRMGGPRPAQLTPLGRVVLTHARSLLAGVDATDEAIERFKAGDGRIHIGTFQSITNVVLPTVLRRLRDRVPAVDIRLFEEETGDPDLGALDLVFWDEPLTGAVDQVRILDDPYVLIARRGQFDRDDVPMIELDGAPMIAQSPIGDQARVERRYEVAGVRPRIVFRTLDNHGVLSMVRAGLGLAVMPMLAVDLRDDDEQLRMHRVAPDLGTRPIHLAWAAGRTLSPLVSTVIALTREVADAIAASRTTGASPDSERH
jgi:DNA-binding transcriptional LysR family regulator